MLDSITIPAPETPVAQVPVVSPESVPAPAAPLDPVRVASPEQAPPAPQAGDPEQEPKKRADQNSFDQRIGQLRAQKTAAEAEAIFARQEATRLRGELQKISQTPIDQMSYEQQQAAQMRHSIKEERFQEKVAEVEQATHRARQARAESFAAKVESVKDRMPDFDQVFETVTISDVAADLIAESDKGPEIAYWLGKNPAQAVRIANLPAHLQGAEIARLEARLTVPSKRTTAAPPPPPQVGASSSPGAKDPQAMTMSEFAEWFRKQGKS